MGKTKAQELKNVRVDFVSFVEEGANGEQFAIFKSKDYKEPEKNKIKNDSEIKENINALEKILNSFKGFFTNETKITQEGNSMNEQDKNDVLNAVKGVNDNVSGLSEKVDGIEKRVAELEAGNDNADEDSAEVENNGAATSQDDNDTDIAEVENNAGTNEPESQNNNMAEIKKSIADLSAQLKKMAEVRNDSNSLDADEDIDDDDEDFENLLF
jgi:hypothetical protein